MQGEFKFRAVQMAALLAEKNKKLLDITERL
jgi:hypothetical protein